MLSNVPLLTALLIAVLSAVHAVSDHKFAHEKLKDIDFAYSVPGASETIFFLSEATKYDSLCAKVISPSFLVDKQGNSFCGSVDEYGKIILPFTSNVAHSILSVDYVTGKQSRADAWYHDLITMEYTFYDVSGAVMTLESVVQFIDGKFKKVARTTLNRTYFSLPMPVKTIEELPNGGRAKIVSTNDYFSYNTNRTLGIQFETDDFALKYASDTVFEAVGVFDSLFPPHFRTIDAQMIEPASWFYSITPRFLKSTLMDLGRAQVNPYGHVADVHNAEFKVNRRSKQVVDLSEQQEEEVLGYPIWGYSEFVFSREVLRENRFIVPPVSRRLNNDPNRKNGNGNNAGSVSVTGGAIAALTNSFKLPVALWQKPPPQTRIGLCIWGSTKMDGQKQIWLHQLEYLDKSQFEFTWVVADVGVSAMDAGRSDTNNNAVLAKLANLSHVRLVESPYGDPLSFEELMQKPNDGSPSAWEMWNNEVENVYRYVIQRLKLSKYNIDAMSPPWAQNMIRKMRNHIIKDKCDIIVYGNNRGYNADVMITYTARMLGVPTVTELLNLFTDPDIVPDVIIGPSVYSIQHDSISSLRIPPLDSGTTSASPRMIVIAPSVDIKRFNGQKPAIDFPKMHGYRPTGGQKASSPPDPVADLTVKPFVIGFVGRLSVEKNVGLFILAAYEIISDFRGKYDTFDVTSKLHFVVIGDGDLKSHLFNLCIMLDIVEYVEFASWLSGDAYIAALGTVDVLVNPSIRSWSETFCIANIEALAMRIPLITFGIGGVGEYIDKDIGRGDQVKLKSPYPNEFNIVHNVVLLEDATAVAISAAVVHLYFNEAVRTHLSHAGRATVENHFHAELQMKQYEELYKDIMIKK